MSSDLDKLQKLNQKLIDETFKASNLINETVELILDYLEEQQKLMDKLPGAGNPFVTGTFTVKEKK